MVFGDAPHVIGGQSVSCTGGTPVDDGSLVWGFLRGYASYQSSVIGAEPDAAITGHTAPHHDIGREVAIGLCVVGHYLSGLGVVDQDALSVAAYPVEPMTVFHHGIDVAQEVETTNAGGAFLVLVDTILVGRHPDAPLAIDINLAWGVIADGRLIELIIQELLEHPVLGVDDKHALMVGGHPEATLVVYLDVPHLQPIGQSLDTFRQHQLAHGGIPAVLFLDVDEGVVLGYDVEVLLVIDKQAVVLALQHSMVVHPGVLPLYGTLFPVQAQQLARIGHDDQS